MFGLWLLTDSDVQTFLEEKENQNTERKPIVTYSVALFMAFHAAENKNRQLDDLSQADFGRVPQRFLRSVRTKSITENFVHWKLRPSFVFVVFQLIFSSWVLAPMPCTIFIRGLSILYFHSSIKLTFLVSKGILCLYDKRNNTWLLVELSFLEFNSASHLWAIELNTLRKIPYPHSPMYSLFICFLSLFFLIETFFIHLSPECLLTEMWRVGGWKSNYSWFMR